MLQTILNLFLANPLIAFIVLPALSLLSLLAYRLYLHPLSPVPGPRLYATTSLPLYLYSYLGTEARTLHALHALYGPILRVAPNSVSIADPTSLHAIYVAAGGFPKAACYRNFDIDGHASIFSALDVKYRAVRAKAVVGMFATGAIREKGLATIEESAGMFVERLKEARERDKIVNVLDLARALAVDAVSGYLFGKRYGGLEERKIESEGEKHDGHGLSAGAFVDTFVAVGRFFLLPNTVFQLLELASARFFPDTTVDKSMATVDSFVDSIVTSTAAYVKDDVDHDIEERNEDTYQARLLRVGISAHETAAQCKDLIFAGTDSTGMNVATACWQLARNPSYLEKVQTELDTNPNPDYPLPPSTHPHLTALLSETLRISMANPTRLPRVVPPGGYTYGRYHLPAGTDIGCASYSLHFDEAVFPDPFAFRPERWLEDSAGLAEEERRERRRRMQASMMPFGVGSRQCIARNLATAELEIALRMVVTSGVLKGAKAVGGQVEILEWFNSKVVGEKIEVEW